METITDPGDFDPEGPRGFDDKATYYILSDCATIDMSIILCTFILLLPIIALYFSISQTQSYLQDYFQTSALRINAVKPTVFHWKCVLTDSPSWILLLR